MEVIQPWNVTLGKVNILNEIIIDDVINELLINVNLTETALEARCTNSLTPNINAMRDDVITRHVNAYFAKTLGAFDGVELQPSGSFGKLVVDGSGMYLHAHPYAFISTILYLSDSSSILNMLDPRNPQVRGVPKEVMSNFNDHFHITPKLGDLWIFPSYLQHYITASMPHMRMSFITDYAFKGRR